MVQKFLFWFLFLACLSTLNGQVKVEATPTGRHAQAIKRAKEAKALTNARKQQIKDNKQKVKEYKRAKKDYKKAHKQYRIAYEKRSFGGSSSRIDSLRLNLPTDSLSLDLSNDSLKLRLDSLKISDEILNSPEFPTKYKALMRRPPVLNKDTLSQQLKEKDSLALARGTMVAEDRAADYLPDELNPTESALDEFGNPLEGGNPMGATPDIGAFPLIKSRPNPNVIKPNKAKELFDKIDPEQFQEVQEDILAKKKVYSKMPDSRYPERAVKRNSLEEVPFRKRLFTGGNISLQSTDPLILDVRLRLGYWINRKWLGGTGITLREQFSSQDSLQALSGDGHGYSVFTRYELPKGFFGWAELEWQVNRSVLRSEQESDQQWQQAHLVGIGREYKVGFVRMTSFLLYDFNHRDNNLNARPWTVRIGFQVSKKP